MIIEADIRTVVTHLMQMTRPQLNEALRLLPEKQFEAVRDVVFAVRVPGIPLKKGFDRRRGDRRQGQVVHMDAWAQPKEGIR